MVFIQLLFVPVSDDSTDWRQALSSERTPHTSPIRASRIGHAGHVLLPSETTRARTIRQAGVCQGRQSQSAPPRESELDDVHRRAEPHPVVSLRPRLGQPASPDRDAGVRLQRPLAAPFGTGTRGRGRSGTVDASSEFAGSAAEQATDDDDVLRRVLDLGQRKDAREYRQPSPVVCLARRRLGLCLVLRGPSDPAPPAEPDAVVPGAHIEDPRPGRVRDVPSCGVQLPELCGVWGYVVFEGVQARGDRGQEAPLFAWLWGSVWVWDGGCGGGGAV